MIIAPHFDQSRPIDDGGIIIANKIKQSGLCTDDKELRANENYRCYHSDVGGLVKVEEINHSEGINANELIQSDPFYAGGLFKDNEIKTSIVINQSDTSDVGGVALEKQINQSGPCDGFRLFKADDFHQSVVINSNENKQIHPLDVGALIKSNMINKSEHCDEDLVIRKSGPCDVDVAFEVKENNQLVSCDDGGLIRDTQSGLSDRIVIKDSGICQNNSFGDEEINESKVINPKEIKNSVSSDDGMMMECGVIKVIIFLVMYS